MQPHPPESGPLVRGRFPVPRHRIDISERSAESEQGPVAGDADCGGYVIRESPSAICVTARGLARPWGAMELQMETVLTLPQLRGEPMGAEPGSRGRRAPPLPSVEPARGFLANAEDGAFGCG